MDDEKPKTSHLVLKPKEIVPTDTRAMPGDGTAISVQLIHQQNRLAEEHSKKRERKGLMLPGPAVPPGFKAPEFTPTNRPAGPGDPPAVSVPEMLLENRIAAERSGWGRIRRWGRRKSRRTRDFILIVGGTDLLVIALMRAMPGVVTMVYGVSALVVVTVSLCWVMFVVMDDY